MVLYFSDTLGQSVDQLDPRAIAECVITLHRLSVDDDSYGELFQLCYAAETGP
jgi:hypothetical protein